MFNSFQPPRQAPDEPTRRAPDSWPRPAPRVASRSKPTRDLVRELLASSHAPTSAEDFGYSDALRASIRPAHAGCEAEETRKAGTNQAGAEKSSAGSEKLGWGLTCLVPFAFLCVDSGKIMVDAWALFNAEGGEHLAFLLLFLQSGVSTVFSFLYTSTRGLDSLKQVFDLQQLRSFFPAAFVYSLSQISLVWAFNVGLKPATFVFLRLLSMPACALVSRYVFLRVYGWLETFALLMLTFSTITFAELHNKKLGTHIVLAGAEFKYCFLSIALSVFGSLLFEKGVKKKYTPEAESYRVQKTQMDLQIFLVSCLGLSLYMWRSGQNPVADWNAIVADCKNIVTNRMLLAVAMRSVHSRMEGLFAQKFSTTGRMVTQCFSLLMIYFIGDRIVMELHEGKPLAPSSKEFTVDVLALVVALSALLYQMGRQRTFAENPHRVAPELCAGESFESPDGTPKHSGRLPNIPALTDGRLFDPAWIQHLGAANAELMRWLSSSLGGQSTQIFVVVGFIMLDSFRTIFSAHVISSSPHVTQQTMVVANNGISIVAGLALSLYVDWYWSEPAPGSAPTQKLREMSFREVISSIWQSLLPSACFSLSQTATCLAYSLKISGAVHGVIGYSGMPLGAILGTWFAQKDYSILQWLALSTITLSAVVFVTLEGEEGLSASGRAIACSLASVLCGSLGGLACERIFKASTETKKKTYPQQKTFLDIGGFVAACSMLLVVPVLDERPTAAFWKKREINGVAVSGFFVGWDLYVVASVCVTVVHAWMSGMVAKNLSGVTKSVAQCVSLLIIYFVGELVIKKKTFYWPIGCMAIVIILSVLVYIWSPPKKEGTDQQVEPQAPPSPQTPKSGSPNMKLSMLCFIFVVFGCATGFFIGRRTSILGDISHATEQAKLMEAQSSREIELLAKLSEQAKAFDEQVSKNAELEAKLLEQSNAEVNFNLRAKILELSETLEIQASKEADLEAKLAEQSEALQTLAEEKAALEAKYAESLKALQSADVEASALEAELAAQGKVPEAPATDVEASSSSPEASHLHSLKWRWAEHLISGFGLVRKTRFENFWNMPMDRAALEKELTEKVQDINAEAKHYKTRAVEFADVENPKMRMTFANYSMALEWLRQDSNIQSRDEL